MMKKNSFKKWMGSSLMVFVLLFSMTGCEQLSKKIKDFKGSLVGISFTIDTFDNFGNKVLTTKGEKVNIEGNVVEEKTYSNDGTGYIETLSSVITIYVDGNEMTSCGDSCIFYEKGLKPDVDFKLEEIHSESDSFFDNTYITGLVNNYKQAFGKSQVVVIKSQTGYPIYAFSGDSVYWEIPDDLPKFTEINIDGKALYIHRANFQIIDKALLK